jgi:UDP-MurNAc hydroxylase
LTNLQDLIATPKIDTAYKFFQNYLSDSSKFKNTALIKINPENIFSLEEKNTLNLYSSINQREYNDYKKNYLKNKKFIYEQNDEESLDGIFDLSKLAFENFLRKKNELNSKIPLDIYIKVKHKYIKISQDIKKDRIDFIERDLINKNNKHIILDLDIRLLKLILKGPKYAHGNNAEIGSHINYFRSPDIHLRNFQQSICYFHC